MNYSGVSVALALSTALILRPIGQAPRCPAVQNIAIEKVSIIATEEQTGRRIAAETLWVPSEGPYNDSIYVRIALRPFTPAIGDSVYGIASLSLILKSTSRRTTGPSEVRFPSKMVADAAVPLTHRTELLIGPFSTNHLIPWKGIAVEATANAIPIGVEAEGSVLQVHRAVSCSENLADNRGRSTIVKLIYAK